jgi:protein-tyrosine phosphatase
MHTVLFICKANKFRSAISAEVFRMLTEKLRVNSEWQSLSAGTWTENGEPAPKITLEMAGKYGIRKMDEHRTRQVDKVLLENANIILVMEANQKEALTSEFPQISQKTFLLSEMMDGRKYDIPDPDWKGIDPDEVTQEIIHIITHGYKKILLLGKNKAN